ncbi:putative alpha/beta superfamily hydrolase [Streptococcus pneumoniae]|uniref:alpha/beta fold hydrolase n=1 Tax=Streptococcus pneumoniae TaxID=1313 RepID=UPI0005DEA440|nr:alpha/beta hydrolase [Streptococcus pneumoniae]CGE88745.1 putative alpha/beta superfamily hydrolase [Streptococcus pneumoniae]CIX64190.1 putative alpha/beta superfamily hydrolase [Streptococcus pneumoniae]CIZ22830.1 putative alpha/beta superfamily hydrolase [Streptococcus pneumoniae]COK17906.1 putative alpha/beta superfamily hydrolase [Streptococcus pneumoniae]VKA47679.1 putative alpha/beta superfamily hydrolase [Streptococcus pneumoniae]
MKLIFLHGLGQSAESWKEVRNLLTDYPSEAIELFPSGVSNYQQAKERVYQHLAQETEPFVLIGLSLGAALTLELSSYDLPNLRALILSGCLLKLAGNILFYLQLLIFKLLPKRVFEKQGADKTLMVGVSEELKTLDLTDIAGTCSYPTLLICGSKDKLNLSSMKALHRLLTDSQFQIIPDGPHVLNKAKPKEFVEKTRSFLELLK